tara:strand:+ start:1730 stop:2668 length:939 start_codon:yes stop_codon:yes gene_type:complete
MRILICGLGSIGQRHLDNLINLGYKDILIVSARKFIPVKFKKIQIFKTIDEALKMKIDLAIVCNPTHLHEITAIKLIKKNINIFLEKPVGYNRKKLVTLKNIIKKYPNNINMVGYMMRFHPAMKIIKNILKKKSLGQIFHFNFMWGEYLPYWHKNENYKKSYAANKSMGGGAALTLSHDLDLAKYLFGEVKQVNIIKSKINSLKINAESAVDILVEFRGNIIGNIHLDYLQKKPTRKLNIYGTDGVLEFDYYKNELSINKLKSLKIKKFKKFKRNDLFVEEIKYFISAIKNKKRIQPNIVSSFEMLKTFKLV